MSADDYPGSNGETLRRQRLPGAAERWEALPWESRMALLSGLAEEAAQHRREADFAASTAMQERYAALAVTYETAHAVLMRADTVSSKDKSPDEVAAERAKYGTLRVQETVLRAMLRAYETAALDAEIAYFAAVDGTPEEQTAERRMDAVQRGAALLREETARCVARPDDMAGLPPALYADYRARLSGARPIDAPPAD